MTAEDRLIAALGVPVEHRTFEAGGRRYHAVVAGSGPAMVLVHGLNIGWGQWYAVLPALARTHTVYALDLVGAGSAEKVDLMAADIAALTIEALDAALRTLVPDGATVVGHSIGGWAALKLSARKHPSVTTIVAVNPMGFTGYIAPKFRLLALRPFARFLSTVAVPPTRDALAAFLGDVMAVKGAMSDEFVDYVFEHVIRPPLTHPVMLIHRLFRPFRIREEFVLSADELASIVCPVTIVHGAEDPLIPLRKVRGAFGRIPGARVIVLENTGHVPPIERPERFRGIIEG